jgi:hypothetical protein
MKKAARFSLKEPGFLFFPANPVFFLLAHRRDTVLAVFPFLLIPADKGFLIFPVNPVTIARVFPGFRKWNMQ